MEPYRRPALPVEGSAHDNGRTMVCAKCGNTEGSPDPNGFVTVASTFNITSLHNSIFNLHTICRIVPVLN
jgi:hypothetical protein